MRNAGLFDTQTECTKKEIRKDLLSYSFRLFLRQLSNVQILMDFCTQSIKELWIALGKKSNGNLVYLLKSFSGSSSSFTNISTIVQGLCEA